MHLQYFFGFYFIFSILLYQVQAQQNATSNLTIIQANVTKKRIMVRKLHTDDKLGTGMMHVVIHKIQPGHPYYKVFDDNETAARGFTNKIWRRLLNRYSTMLI
ncbi:uncharacterized protein LOC108112345 [Drosophila eugracilis]|uniref:uncharacterized protein LOC108112345 n=1 Tax=Drosophila eugracilis TaxID=29029 RepID=UPI0007E87C2C|nr:uncharacterized protein LOC108112345 [Drosophila eugracilis]